MEQKYKKNMLKKAIEYRKKKSKMPLLMKSRECLSKEKSLNSSPLRMNIERRRKINLRENVLKQTVGLREPVEARFIRKIQSTQMMIDELSQYVSTVEN